MCGGSYLETGLSCVNLDMHLRPYFIHACSHTLSHTHMYPLWCTESFSDNIWELRGVFHHHIVNTPNWTLDGLGYRSHPLHTQLRIIHAVSSCKVFKPHTNSFLLTSPPNPFFCLHLLQAQFLSDSFRNFQITRIIFYKVIVSLTVPTPRLISMPTFAYPNSLNGISPAYNTFWVTK